MTTKKNENQIKSLICIDLDGTLMNSPEKEYGKKKWKEVTGDDYPHVGWWGRPESLNLDVFDIQPFQSMLNILHDEYANPDSYVIILTNRMVKLELELQKILDKHNIKVDELNTKRGNKSKDQRIMDYVEKFPNLEEIDVYDDMDEQITTLKKLYNELPDEIELNIFKVDNGNISKIKNINEMIFEELHNLIKK